MIYRHGDVVLTTDAVIPVGAKEIKPRAVAGKVGHILAEGEVTGHAHRIDPECEVTMYEKDGKTYLSVKEEAPLTHEEHHTIDLPAGDYSWQIQREYEPDGWREVAD